MSNNVINNEPVHGYKVFNPDWTCRDFQYEVGKTFEENVKPSCCGRGFHFCKEAIDCFNYYAFNPKNKVAEVIALGELDTDGDKSCTNKIQIVREVPWIEVLTIVNIGKENTGIGNTGNCNAGNENTGDWSSGYWNSGTGNAGDGNTGDFNTGNWNTGNGNTGNRNTGNRNTGSRNTGDRNTGDYNTGDMNTGDWNNGNCNIGDCNTGSRNIGDWNTGSCNVGECNTGSGNTGDRNTGNMNSGSFNTGDFNNSSFNAGCFNVKEHKIMLFDKPSDMTYQDWLDSKARELLRQIPKSAAEWVNTDDMTDEEKVAHSTYKTTGGYLKELDKSECCQMWWDSLDIDDKEIIKAIPNFDPDIFYECTGIKVD